MDEYRKTGRTTRLIDNYIQELFENNKIVVKDHFDEGKDLATNIFLAKLIVRRMNMEHKGIKPKIALKDFNIVITI